MNKEIKITPIEYRVEITPLINSLYNSENRIWAIEQLVDKLYDAGYRRVIDSINLPDYNCDMCREHDRIMLEENERLKCKVSDLECIVKKECHADIERVRTEAIKEFAESLKSRLIEDIPPTSDNREYTLFVIDELVKERTEEK